MFDKCRHAAKMRENGAYTGGRGPAKVSFCVLELEKGGLWVFDMFLEGEERGRSENVLGFSVRCV